jgi:hypothetical protein
MFITARLYNFDAVVQDESIQFNKIYAIEQKHHDLLGPQLIVVAGPHTDFCTDGVYTVKLLCPPIPTPEDMPFFNANFRSAHEHAHIYIMHGPHSGLSNIEYAV